jgi:hypothetical protein
VQEATTEATAALPVDLALPARLPRLADAPPDGSPVAAGAPPGETTPAQPGSRPGEDGLNSALNHFLTQLIEGDGRGADDQPRALHPGTPNGGGDGAEPARTPGGGPGAGGAGPSATPGWPPTDRDGDVTMAADGGAGPVAYPRARPVQRNVGMGVNPGLNRVIPQSNETTKAVLGPHPATRAPVRSTPAPGGTAPAGGQTAASLGAGASGVHPVPALPASAVSASGFGPPAAGSRATAAGSRATASTFWPTGLGSAEEGNADEWEPAPRDARTSEGMLGTGTAPTGRAASPSRPSRPPTSRPRPAGPPDAGSAGSAGPPAPAPAPGPIGQASRDQLPATVGQAPVTGVGADILPGQVAQAVAIGPPSAVPRQLGYLRAAKVSRHPLKTSLTYAAVALVGVATAAGALGWGISRNAALSAARRDLVDAQTSLSVINQDLTQQSQRYDRLHRTMVAFMRQFEHNGAQLTNANRQLLTAQHQLANTQDEVTETQRRLNSSQQDLSTTPTRTTQCELGSTLGQRTVHLLASVNLSEINYLNAAHSQDVHVMQMDMKQMERLLKAEQAIGPRLTKAVQHCTQS